MVTERRRRRWQSRSLQLLRDEGICVTRCMLTTGGDGQACAARVRPGLRPGVRERFGVLGVIIAPRRLVPMDGTRDPAEDVWLSDDNVVGPPPENTA